MRYELLVLVEGRREMQRQNLGWLEVLALMTLAFIAGYLLEFFV